MAVTEKIKASPLAMGLIHQARRQAGKVAVSRHEGRGDAVGAALLAIRGALRDSPTAAERPWVDKIERKRAELEQSTTVFEVPKLRDLPATTDTIGRMALSSKPPRWAYMLFRLVRELSPVAGLEMGACVGISAAYQAAAMELNGVGRLTSLEGVPALAKRSADTIDELGLTDRVDFVQGRFVDTLTDALDQGPLLDWAFIDGDHHEDATLQYGSMVLRHCTDRAVIVFDDIAWSDGMARAWRAICADPRYGTTIDLRRVGIAIPGGRFEQIRIPYA